MTPAAPSTTTAHRKESTMHTTPTLATRFARSTRVLRSETPLTEDRMRQTAPSIFATGKHISRSEKYAYIPTIDVLRGLQHEGFEPFMVAQGHSRIEGKAEYTKHLVRLRHADQARSRPEVNEIILINSHDGASCYQLLAGQFRFVCHNGLVVGDVAHDIRIPHRQSNASDLRANVIEGAFRVLDDFEAVDQSTAAMKSIELAPEEERALARAALTLRYGERADGEPPPPISADQLTQPRRPEDQGRSLWLGFQRIQEALTRGGVPGRTVQGRRMRTREVASIDRGVALNRALWTLAEEMRRLKE
jgi:hypothetical protein